MADEFNTQKNLEAIAEYADKGTTLKDIRDYASTIKPWIDIYKMSKLLEQFNKGDQLYQRTALDGVFGAIQYVKDYETNKIGKVYTDLSDPKELASSVAYINREQILNELAKKLNLGFDDQLTKQQADKLSNAKAMQELLNQQSSIG